VCINTFFKISKKFLGGITVSTFADRLKELRKAKGLSQKALAELFGASE